MSPFYNDVVRNNTLSPARVANALDAGKAYTASGTDTYSATVFAAYAQYTSGDEITITFTNANTSTTTSINLNGLGAKSLKDGEGNDLGIGDLKAGATYKFIYNGTHFRMIGAAGGGSVPDADASTKGIAKLYTTTDGTNTDGAPSQDAVNSKLRATRTVTGTDNLIQADDNTLIIFNSATPFNFTLDQLTAGTKVSFVNYGTGAVTFINGSGVTLTANPTAVLAGVTDDIISSALVIYDTITTPRVITGGAAASSGVTYWQTLPGTPTRVSNTQLTITDTGNANLYNLKFGKTTVLKWTDTGSTKLAMVSLAAYSSNTVTIDIIGDVLSSGATMNTFTFALEKATEVRFVAAGTIATGSDITAKYHAARSEKVFGGKAFHGTAGTTNATTYDVNKNLSTMFTTKLSVASGATAGTTTTADDGTTLAADDAITVDCDSVSTTAPQDAYIKLFLFPLNNQYL